MVVVCAALTALVSFVTLGAAAPTSGPSVSTSQGTWLGASVFGVESYKGIPFAEPPVGNLRFAAPVPTTKNFGTVDATRYGKSCPQLNFANGVFPGFFNNIAQDVLDLVTSLPILSAIASTECVLSVPFAPPPPTARTLTLSSLLQRRGGLSHAQRFQAGRRREHGKVARHGLGELPARCLYARD